jgi:hypothetical protein
MIIKENWSLLSINLADYGQIIKNLIENSQLSAKKTLKLLIY